MSVMNPRTFYYTFGTSETFPFQKGWVEVKAQDREQANELFQRHFPDRTPGVLNCACSYSEEHFQTIQHMANNFEDWKICHAVISSDGIKINAPERPVASKRLADLLVDAKTRIQANSHEPLQQKEIGHGR